MDLCLFGIHFSVCLCACSSTFNCDMKWSYSGHMRENNQLHPWNDTHTHSLSLPSTHTVTHTVVFITLIDLLRDWCRRSNMRGFNRRLWLAERNRNKRFDGWVEGRICFSVVKLLVALCSVLTSLTLLMWTVLMTYRRTSHVTQRRWEGWGLRTHERESICF